MRVGSVTKVDSGDSKWPDILKIIWPMLLVLVIFLYVQKSSLTAWWVIWNQDDSYYSHGPLVPVLAAIMIWTRRHKLARTQAGSSKFGILLLLLFLPLFALSSLTGVREIQAAAFMAALFGCSLLTLGVSITRILSIPYLFLVTMMPVSGFLLDAATGRFQLISTTVATWGLKLGIDAQQIGNTIVSDSLPEPLLIGIPCSGLRLLISLITFSWLFVYIFKGAWWKKTLLLILSLPLSIFINSLRIALIGVVGVATQSSDWMHKFHDYSGMIGLILCFVILFGIAKLMRVDDLVGADEGQVPPIKPSAGGQLAGAVIAVLIMAVPLLLSSHIAPLYDYPKGQIDRARVPGNMSYWTYMDQEISQDTLKTLDKGDLMSRLYIDNEHTQKQVEVFLDVAYDYTAFHDPHLCLPGGGSPVTEDAVVYINLSKPVPVTVSATRLEATSDYGTNLLVYWYQVGDKAVPGTRDMAHIFRSWRAGDFKRMLTRPWEIDKLRSEVLERKITWYRFSTNLQGDGSDDAFILDFIKQWFEAYGSI